MVDASLHCLMLNIMPGNDTNGDMTYLLDHLSTCRYTESVIIVTIPSTHNIASATGWNSGRFLSDKLHLITSALID